MLHIYRQITSLRRVRPVVIAQKRENADCFPFHEYSGRKKTGDCISCDDSGSNKLRDRPWQISPAEVRATERALTETQCASYYIFILATSLCICSR